MWVGVPRVEQCEVKHDPKSGPQVEARSCEVPAHRPSTSVKGTAAIASACSGNAKHVDTTHARSTAPRAILWEPHALVALFGCLRSADFLFTRFDLRAGNS